MSRRCEVEACPKGGEHREAYLATACRLYHQNHTMVIRPDGSAVTVPKHGRISKGIRDKSVVQELIQANPKAGTLVELQATAKGLKIKGRRWMKREDLEAAIQAKADGDETTLANLQLQACERAQQAWSHWKQKRAVTT